ncbi:hypothetical protein [Intestinimonas sp. HCP28S3_D6]|uniref:hypothetical protein n=1 Tax=Intestinimonas sp. HCP28S3_D6 TaxID=3438942 RepID=UPI003F89D07D
MKKQETFTDIEYSFRKKKTKREEFLEIMDEIIPWDEWVGVNQLAASLIATAALRSSSMVIAISLILLIATFSFL